MYLTFDTETTGLPADWKAPVTAVNNWPRMVQVAWLNHDAEGNLINKHSHIIKPEGYRIPHGAAKVHGITTERAAAEGEDLAEILQLFVDDVANAKYIIAHNMSFDEKIIGAELVRKSISPPTTVRYPTATVTNGLPSPNYIKNYSEKTSAMHTMPLLMQQLPQKVFLN